MAELLASKTPSHRNSQRRRNEVDNGVESAESNEEARMKNKRRGEPLYSAGEERQML